MYVLRKVARNVNFYKLVSDSTSRETFLDMGDRTTNEEKQQGKLQGNENRWLRFEEFPK